MPEPTVEPYRDVRALRPSRRKNRLAGLSSNSRDPAPDSNRTRSVGRPACRDQPRSRASRPARRRWSVSELSARFRQYPESSRSCSGPTRQGAEGGIRIVARGRHHIQDPRACFPPSFRKWIFILGSSWHTWQMDNQYPIGKFTFTSGNTLQERAAAIDDIAAAPQRLRGAVAGL